MMEQSEEERRENGDADAGVFGGGRHHENESSPGGTAVYLPQHLQSASPADSPETVPASSTVSLAPTSAPMSAVAARGGAAGGGASTNTNTGITATVNTNDISTPVDASPPIVPLGFAPRTTMMTNFISTERIRSGTPSYTSETAADPIQPRTVSPSRTHLPLIPLSRETSQNDEGDQSQQFSSSSSSLPLPTPPPRISRHPSRFLQRREYRNDLELNPRRPQHQQEIPIAEGSTTVAAPFENMNAATSASASTSAVMTTDFIMERVLFRMHVRICNFSLQISSNRGRRWIEHLCLVMSILCFGALVLLHTTFVVRTTHATTTATIPIIDAAKYTSNNGNLRPNCATTCLTHHLEKTSTIGSMDTSTLESQSHYRTVVLPDILHIGIKTPADPPFSFSTLSFTPTFFTTSSFDDPMTCPNHQSENCPTLSSTTWKTADLDDNESDQSSIVWYSFSTNKAYLLLLNDNHDSMSYQPPLRKQPQQQEQQEQQQREEDNMTSQKHYHWLQDHVSMETIVISPHDINCFGEPFIQSLSWQFIKGFGFGSLLDTIIWNWLLGVIAATPSADSSLPPTDRLKSDASFDHLNIENYYVYHHKTRRVVELQSPKNAYTTTRDVTTSSSPSSSEWFYSMSKMISSFFMKKLWVVFQTCFLYFFCTTLISFTLRETQERMLEFTQELRHRVLLSLPLIDLITTHVIQTLVFVPITVGMMFFLIESYHGDKFLAFLVMTIVWCVEVFSVISLRSFQGMTFFPKIFFLLFSLFHVYHFANPYGFSYLALVVAAAFMWHSMTFFWHRYELPAVALRYITIDRPRMNMDMNTTNSNGTGNRNDGINPQTQRRTELTLTRNQQHQRRRQEQQEQQTSTIVNPTINTAAIHMLYPEVSTTTELSWNSPTRDATTTMTTSTTATTTSTSATAPATTTEGTITPVRYESPRPSQQQPFHPSQGVPSSSLSSLPFHQQEQRRQPQPQPSLSIQTSSGAASSSSSTTRATATSHLLFGDVVSSPSTTTSSQLNILGRSHPSFSSSSTSSLRSSSLLVRNNNSLSHLFRPFTDNNNNDSNHDNNGIYDGEGNVGVDTTTTTTNNNDDGVDEDAADDDDGSYMYFMEGEVVLHRRRHQNHQQQVQEQQSRTFQQEYQQRPNQLPTGLIVPASVSTSTSSSSCQGPVDNNNKSNHKSLSMTNDIAMTSTSTRRNVEDAKTMTMTTTMTNNNNNNHIDDDAMNIGWNMSSHEDDEEEDNDNHNYKHHQQQQQQRQRRYTDDTHIDSDMLCACTSNDSNLTPLIRNGFHKYDGNDNDNDKNKNKNSKNSIAPSPTTMDEIKKEIPSMTMVMKAASTAAKSSSLSSSPPYFDGTTTTTTNSTTTAMAVGRKRTTSAATTATTAASTATGTISSSFSPSSSASSPSSSSSLSSWEKQYLEELSNDGGALKAILDFKLSPRKGGGGGRQRQRQRQEQEDIEKITGEESSNAMFVDRSSSATATSSATSTTSIANVAMTGGGTSTSVIPVVASAETSTEATAAIDNDNGSTNSSPSLVELPQFPILPS